MRVLTHPARLIKPGVFLISGILLMVEPALSEEWIPVYEEPRHRAVFDNDHAMNRSKLSRYNGVDMGIFLFPACISM